MKHQKKGRKFGRERNQRRALMKGLAVNLIAHGRIKTTLPKAKELRGVVERLVTHAKRGVTKGAGYRLTQKTLPKAALGKLVKEIAPRYHGRMGGYTRIIKLPLRSRDAAKVAYIEFV